MPSAGFETAIPTIERPQSYTSDRTATGIRFLTSHHVESTFANRCPIRNRYKATGLDL